MPIAKPDTARTLRGTPVVIAVLGNDQGSSLNIVGYSLPVTGTLVLNADRTFTYTPTAGFVGLDAFAYTVRDGVGGTAQGEVTITVTRPNSAPNAVDDAVQTLAGAAVDVAMLANDNDPDGDALALIGIDAPGHGTVTVLPDRSVRYVPQPGFSGLDSFAYTVSDGMGAVDTAQVRITVGVANSGPLARDDVASTSEGEAVTIDVLANDNDPDGGPVALHGFTMPGHGTLSPTPDDRLVYTPADGFSGTDYFSYVVSDDEGATATGHATVTVASTNADPVAVSDFALSSGAPVTLDLLANDNDPDGDTLRLAGLTLPIEGEIALQPDGRVTYNPPAGYTGTDSFTYQVTDGTSVAEAEVHIGVSAPPVSTFANGYVNQHELRLPSWAAGAPLIDNFLLPVAEQRADLKSAAHGGPVQSASGWDLRFETVAGAKLGHVILSYDGATGTLVALVNMPRAFASTESIFLYTGKSGLAGSEEDPVAARAGGWLAWFAGHLGADRTSQSRDLTPSGLAPAMLGNWPAASLDGVDDKFTQTGSAWLNGLSALTVISLHQASRTDLKSEVFNIAAGAAAELSLHFATQNDRLTATAKFGTTLYQYQSANDQQTTQPQAVAFVAAAGAAMRMAINGVTSTAGQGSGNLAGTLSVADTLEWGAGGRGDLIHWPGKLAFLGFCSTALPAAATEAMTAAMVDPRLVYGIGDANTVTVPNRSPVGLPLKGQTANAGQAKNFTVTTAAWDPNGDGLTVTDAVLITGTGVVSVPNTTQVRFVPDLASAGAFVIEFGLRDAGGKTSRGRLYGTVAASSAVDLFLNPFNKRSAHHRPIGAGPNGTGAEAGVPGGTANPTAANPVYDAPGAVNSRGRLANVNLFRCGASAQGRKYTYRVATSHPQRTIVDEAGAPADNKLPFTLRMPPGVDYPSTTGDDVIQLWPRNGGATDVSDLFFNFEDSAGKAKRRYEYPLGGTDIPDGSDNWDRGSSASGLRFPGTVLRGFEINAASPAPIRHALNVTATRHSNEGAPASAHVLGKKRVWPAIFVDGSSDSPDQNLGDLPYGTRIFIRWQDRDQRSSLGLSARGLVLFDTFLYFGCYIVDGQGQHSSGGGVLQLRVDQDITTATVDDVDTQLQKILPLLYPLRNPRRHKTETELHTDGLPYAGGGGPVGPGSINTAWDAQ